MAKRETKKADFGSNEVVLDVQEEEREWQHCKK